MLGTFIISQVSVTVLVLAATMAAERNSHIKCQLSGLEQALAPDYRKDSTPYHCASSVLFLDRNHLLGVH